MNPGSNYSVLFATRWYVIGLAILLSLVLLLLRVSDLDLVLNGLWGEDGSIFINEVVRNGAGSIITPYAGYLHFYPRLFSFFALLVPLSLLPKIFLVGWFVSFLALVWVLIDCGRSAGLGVVSTLVVLAYIIIQPINGEVFFTLTNAQWFLGLSFALYVCVAPVRPPNPISIILLALASLTGPFSLLMVPTLVLRLSVLRDFSTRKWFYITIIACSIIQLFVILSSARVGSQDFDTNLYHWIQSGLRFFSFGGVNGTILLVSAFIFWLILFVNFIRHLFVFKSINVDKREYWIPVLLLSTAFVMYISGLFLHRHNPISLMGGGRYYMIPYSLIVFVVFYLTKWKPLLHVVLAMLLGVICLSEIKTVVRSNLQWAAYAEWARTKPDIIIPINPLVDRYPGWSVQLSDSHLSDMRSAGAAKNNTYDIASVLVQKRTDDQQLEEYRLPFEASIKSLGIDIDGICVDSSLLAVEIGVVMHQPGNVVFSWGREYKYDTNNYLRRYYGQGDVSMQFAFRRGLGDSRLGVYFENQAVVSRVNTVRLSCLK